MLNPDTKVLVLQPGSNDARMKRGHIDTAANIASIKAIIASRHVRLVMVTDQMYHGLPYQSDEMHLTPEGYRALAMELAPQVASALRH